MVDKNFLIINENEDDVTLKQKAVEFVRNIFGELNLDKISVKIENYTTEETPWIEWKCIEIKFNEFKYYNRIHGECVQSVSIELEDKGLQVFYINGQFKSLNVFQWMEGSLIQKVDTIYGVPKEKIYEEFNDYILTC